MEAIILMLLGIMGSWNVAVTMWMLKNRRNNKRNNPHPPPCEEHRRTLARLEVAINGAVNKLNEMETTVAVLWHDAYPGQEEPGKR